MRDPEIITESVFAIQLHIVLVTKNSQQIFNGPIKSKLRETIREICQEQQVEILSGNVSVDHVHLVVGIHPKVNINKLILLLKGKTTYALFTTFPTLRDSYYNRHLWSKGCFCCSCGEVNDDQVQQYVESQLPRPNDDDNDTDTESTSESETTTPQASEETPW
jgi:putative transposase